MPDHMIETPLTQDVIKYILEMYGLVLIELQPCRRVWQIKTNAGYKYLKRSKLKQADLWFISDALEYLHRNSFKNTPRLVWSKKEEPFVNLRSGLYVLTDWYFGEEMDFRNLMDLKQSTRLMAEFHLKSAGFTPNHENNQRSCWLKWPDKLENRLKQLQEFRRLANLKKETCAFSRLFLRHFEPYYRQAVTSYQALLDSPYEEVAIEAYKNRSFCHHDYSGRNLLRTYTNQLFLVDFDYCLLDLRIHDLINLILRNLKHNHWNPELCNFIFREYQQITKLSKEEFEVMYVLLSWPQDYWQVGLQYYYEKLPWPDERFIKKLHHKVDSRFEREKFLKEFPGCLKNL